MVSQAQYEAIMGVVVTLPTPEELFDFQVEILRKKGVVNNPDELLPLRELIPKQGLFIMVPQTALSLAELVERVELDGKSGKNWLEEGRVEDVVKTPKTHYLCLAVEDGRRMLNVSPGDAVKRFAKDGRSAYTAREGIFHAMYFPEVLKRHFMDLPGSRYGAGNVPGLDVYDGRPYLYYYWSFYANPGWGSASCGSRVGL